METAKQLEARIIARTTRDPDFRERLLADPLGVLEGECGLTIPEGYSVEVHEESGTHSHMVLPPSSQIPEAELAAIAGGESPWDNDSQVNEW